MMQRGDNISFLSNCLKVNLSYAALFVCALICFLMSSPVLAQNTDAFEEADDLNSLLISDRVYKLEVVIFAYKNTIDTEDWQQSDTFRYPRTLKRLNESNTSEIILPFKPEDDDISIAATDLNQLLGKDQLELGPVAYSFKARQGYRLLYHGSWYQQVDAFKKSTPILIEGGKWYSPYYELSGSITFSKGRFLQAQTDLWLTDFLESDLGNTHTPWHATSSSNVALTLPSSNDARRIASGRGQDTYSVDRLSQNQNDSNLLYEYDQQPSVGRNEHIPQRVFQLKQKRKLQSGEMHYLDHPKFGVIILAKSISDVYADKLP